MKRMVEVGSANDADWRASGDIDLDVATGVAWSIALTTSGSDCLILGQLGVIRTTIRDSSVGKILLITQVAVSSDEHVEAFLGWIYPPGMAASLPKQLTAVVAQVKQQFAALHAEIGTSSKSRPAASFAA